MLNAEEVNQEDNGGGEIERSKAEVNTGDNSGNGTGSARKQSNKMTIPVRLNTQSHGDAGDVGDANALFTL